MIKKKINKNIEIQSVIISAPGILQPSFIDDPYFFKTDTGQYVIPEYSLIKYEKPQPGQAAKEN